MSVYFKNLTFASRNITLMIYGSRGVDTPTLTDFQAMAPDDAARADCLTLAGECHTAAQELLTRRALLVAKREQSAFLQL